MVFVICYSARTQERFENIVEEGAIGGTRKYMSLLTLRESSENKQYGAEV